MGYNFSFIIPHHSIPELLMRCLTSIPVREDVQIIIVDDNSPDANTYLNRYPEFSRPGIDFIRTTKGGGAGFARNEGLLYAKGKWVTFADADDLFVDNLSNILDSFPKDETADIIFYRNRSVLSDDILTASPQAEYLNNLISQYFETGDENGLRCRHIVPWGKFFKRSFILSHSLRFDEIPYSNDVCFSIAANCDASSVRIQDTYLYIHTLRSGSLSADFANKPGELELRAETWLRGLIILSKAGRKIEGRNPISDLLLKLYKKNRPYYDVIISRLPEAKLSIWDILRQVGAWEPYLTKIRLYIHTLPLIIKSHYNHGINLINE